MAKAVSEEEIQFRKRARRRLVGAIALVVAAIVFLPMLLDSKPEERTQEIDIRIPPEDSVEPLSADDPAAGAAQAESAGDSGGAPTAEKAEKPETSVQGNERSSSLPIKPSLPAHSGVGKQAEGNRPGRDETETGKLSSPSPANDGFVVQLGAFSSSAKARQQVEVLASRSPSEYADRGNGSGPTVYTETLKADKGSGKGEVTRVRIGPFATREQADAALAKLKLQGLDGVVTDK